MRNGGKKWSSIGKKRRIIIILNRVSFRNSQAKISFKECSRNSSPELYKIIIILKKSNRELEISLLLKNLLCLRIIIMNSNNRKKNPLFYKKCSKKVL